MGVKKVSDRWLKASRALKKENQVYGQRLVEMAKKHSSEAFYALDDQSSSRRAEFASLC